MLPTNVLDIGIFLLPKNGIGIDSTKNIISVRSDLVMKIIIYIILLAAYKTKLQISLEQNTFRTQMNKNKLKATNYTAKTQTD